jgi:hypothetical protein
MRSLPLEVTHIPQVVERPTEQLAECLGALRLLLQPLPVNVPQGLWQAYTGCESGIHGIAQICRA